MTTRSRASCAVRAITLSASATALAEMNVSLNHVPVRRMHRLLWQGTERHDSARLLQLHIGSLVDHRHRADLDDKPREQPAARNYQRAAFRSTQLLAPARRRE